MKELEENINQLEEIAESLDSKPIKAAKDSFHSLKKKRYNLRIRILENSYDPDIFIHIVNKLKKDMSTRLCNKYNKISILILYPISHTP